MVLSLYSGCNAMQEIPWSYVDGACQDRFQCQSSLTIFSLHTPQPLGQQDSIITYIQQLSMTLAIEYRHIMSEIADMLCCNSAGRPAHQWLMSM